MVRFYVGEITGTTPQTVKIYTDESTSVDVTVSEGNKWYTYVLPKDKVLRKIRGHSVKKVVVKADISFKGDSSYPPQSIIPTSTIEASFKGSNTSNVTDMFGLFGLCSGLTSLDVSNFDTSNVTNMERMFYNCSGLTFLDLSGWDMSNVTTMNQMFDGCTSLKTIRMKGCNQTTINKITNAKPSSARIVTE